jgi:hypothetical protein
MRVVPFTPSDSARLLTVLDKKMDRRKCSPRTPCLGRRDEIVERRPSLPQCALYVRVHRRERVSRTKAEGYLVRNGVTDARHSDQRLHEILQRLAPVQRDCF